MSTKRKKRCLQLHLLDAFWSTHTHTYIHIYTRIWYSRVFFHFPNFSFSLGRTCELCWKTTPRLISPRGRSTSVSTTDTRWLFFDHRQTVWKKGTNIGTENTLRKKRKESIFRQIEFLSYKIYENDRRRTSRETARRVRF